MKSTIWTKWRTDLHPTDDLCKPRCIFNGDIPHLLRANDNIQILDGYAVHTIEHVTTV